MNLRHFIRMASCLLLLLSGCLSAPEQESTGKVEPVERDLHPSIVVMENRLLRMEILPESMGRIGAINWRENAAPLLAPYREWELVDNPLFPMRSNNGCGIRELFWKMPVASSANPMRLIAQRENELVFESDFYGNVLFGVRRTVRLLPDRAEIDFITEVTRRGETPGAYSLWLNFIPSQPAEPQIPLPAGTHAVRGRGNVDCGSAESLAPGAPGEQMLPAGRQWTGAYLKSTDTMLVFRTTAEEFVPDGFFYSWQGNTSSGPVLTFEPVFATRRLKPGEKTTHRWSLSAFRGIRHLRGLYRQIAIDAAWRGGRLVMTVASSADFSGADAALRSINADREADTVSIHLPAIPAGEFRTVEVTVRRPLQLTLTIDDTPIKLIGPFEE